MHAHAGVLAFCQVKFGIKKKAPSSLNPPGGSTKDASVLYVWHGQAEVHHKAVCQRLERGGPGWEGFLLPAYHQGDPKTLPKWPIVGNLFTHIPHDHLHAKKEGQLQWIYSLHTPVKTAGFCDVKYEPKISHVRICSTFIVNIPRINYGVKQYE